MVQPCPQNDWKSRWKSLNSYESENPAVELETERVRELITKGRIPRNSCDGLVWLLNFKYKAWVLRNSAAEL